MTDDGPIVSIVIAVRNGAGTLQRALDSVFEQTSDRVEVIVMDGASTDGTRSIVERNTARIAYWESAPDRGIYHAWNKALDHATGEWLVFIGADDRLAAPDVVAGLSPILAEALPRYQVVYTAVDMVDESGTPLRRHGAPWSEVRRAFRDGMSIPHPATFHHRSLFTTHGHFDERFQIAGDYEFLLRELLDHDALFVPDLVAVSMAAGGVSDRPETLLAVARENHRARRMHGLTRLPEWVAPIVLRTRGRAFLRTRFGPGAETAVASIYRAIRHPGRDRTGAGGR